MTRACAFVLVSCLCRAQTFEVASIKLHRAAVDAPVLKNPDINPIHISGNRVELQTIALKGLIMAAYNVKEYQVSGGPGWATGLDVLYDIAAKTEGDTAQSMAQIRVMLQALLTERFHLKLGRESKQLSVYNLVIAKGGLKLKAVAGDEPPTPGTRRGSMEQLAALLSLLVDRPLIDKTGLSGIYEYSNNLTLLDMGAQDSADVIATTLTTMQMQLGLRAEPAKAMLEMLVIESAEKPSENMASPQEPSARFEAASIRQHQGYIVRTGPLTVSSPLIRMEGYTIFGLVMDAYHVRDLQLVFGKVVHPDDIYDTQYDLVARAPGDIVPSLDEARVMLRTLLADRFKLRVHRETREMQVYALVVGKNGPKLKASSASGQCSVNARLASDGRNNEETFSNCPMERLADRLTNVIGDRPVLDQTGLTGGYEFRLVVIPEYRSRDRSDPADISPNAAVEELGLKLVPQKARIDTLAVDHVEKPDEN